MFAALKDVVVGQAVRLMSGPGLSKLAGSPRVMNVAMKALNLGGAVKTNVDKATKLAAGALGFATQEEVDTLRSTVRDLEDTVAGLRSGPQT